jgi:hypothetical protein
MAPLSGFACRVGQPQESETQGLSGVNPLWKFLEELPWTLDSGFGLMYTILQ